MLEQFKVELNCFNDPKINIANILISIMIKSFNINEFKYSQTVLLSNHSINIMLNIADMIVKIERKFPFTKSVQKSMLNIFRIEKCLFNKVSNKTISCK